MTDYRDINRPIGGFSNNPYEMQRSGSGIGGIVIAIAVVVIVFLGLSLLAGPGTSDNATAPAVVDDKAASSTVTGSATGTAPQTPQAVPATPSE